jgi:hypothetical protein
MVFVRCACAAVDAENRLRGGCLPLADPWRFPPPHVAAAPLYIPLGTHACPEPIVLTRHCVPTVIV